MVINVCTGVPDRLGSSALFTVCDVSLIIPLRSVIRQAKSLEPKQDAAFHRELLGLMSSLVVPRSSSFSVV